VTLPRLLRLINDRAGSAVVEFALIAPVLLIVLMGVFDIGYNMWATTMLQGSLQQAARASTIEGAQNQITSIDAIISNSVHRVVPEASVTFARKSYTNFSDVGTPEDYTDSNKDNACDNNEPYEDSNGNGTWDSDRGKIGNGGARDAVLYTVTMTYPRAFPLIELIGVPATVSTAATTVLRNQPFKKQEVSSTVGYCA
jgi:Flp pilus assembly protein TadG